MFWLTVTLFALCNGLTAWKASFRNISPSERPLLLEEDWFELATSLGAIGWFAVPVMFGWKYGVLAAVVSAAIYVLVGILLYLLINGCIYSFINYEHIQNAMPTNAVSRDASAERTEQSKNVLSTDASIISDRESTNRDFGSPELRQTMQDLRKKREAAALKAQQQMKEPREKSEVALNQSTHKKSLWILNRANGQLIRRTSGKSFSTTQYYRDGSGYIIKDGEYLWAADGDIEVIRVG